MADKAIVKLRCFDADFTNVCLEYLNGVNFCCMDAQGVINKKLRLKEGDKLELTFKKVKA